jgi:preprotein translocase subunit YajC
MVSSVPLHAEEITMFFSIAWAQASAPPQPSIIEQSFPFILIVAVFYWFIIRPAQNRQKTQATFQTAMKRGDSVITSGGILGTIEGITEQFVVLEVADGVRIRILKNQIAGNAQQELVKK